MHPAAWPQLKHLQNALSVYVECLKAKQVEYEQAKAAYEDVRAAVDALKEACDDLPRLPSQLLFRLISTPGKETYENLYRAGEADSEARDIATSQSQPHPVRSERREGPAAPLPTAEEGNHSRKGAHGSHAHSMIQSAPTEEPEEQLEAKFMRELSEFSSGSNHLIAKCGLLGLPRMRHHLELRDLVSHGDLKSTIRAMQSALLHLYGEEQLSACTKCQASLGPFAQCIRFPYRQDMAETRSCTNCFYRYESRCSLPDKRLGRPQLRVDESIRTITELYEQWYEGRNEVPPLVDLDRVYGHLWERPGTFSGAKWSFTRERKLLAAIDIVAKERQISPKALCGDLDEVIERQWEADPHGERMNHRLLYKAIPGFKKNRGRGHYLTISQDDDDISDFIQHIRTLHT